jgi:predicted secreted protein
VLSRGAFAAVLGGSTLLVACGAPQRASDGALVFQVANQSGEAREPTALKGEMEVGQRLEIRLGASAGTGFSWQMAGPAPAVMSLQTTDPAGTVTPVAGEAGRPGGGTVTTFAMTAVAQGDAQLRFVLARPWEKGVSPARVVDVAVTVTPKAAPGGR